MSIKDVIRDNKALLKRADSATNGIADLNAKLAAQGALLATENAKKPWDRSEHNIQSIHKRLERLKVRADDYVKDAAKQIAVTIVKIAKPGSGTSKADKDQVALDKADLDRLEAAAAKLAADVDAAIHDADNASDDVIMYNVEKRIKEMEKFDISLPALYPEYAKFDAERKLAIEKRLDELKDRTFYREKFARDAEVKAKEEKRAQKAMIAKKRAKKQNIVEYIAHDPEDLEPGEHHGTLYDVDKLEKFYADFATTQADIMNKIMEAEGVDALNRQKLAGEKVRRAINRDVKKKGATLMLGIGAVKERRPRVLSPALKEWNDYWQAYHRDHPDLTPGEAMKAASAQKNNHI